MSKSRTARIDLLLNRQDADPRPLSGKRAEKQKLSFSISEWTWPLLFLLVLAAIGLQFYPAIIFAVLILLNRFKKDRYDFIIMLTLLLGGYGMTNSASYAGLPSYYVAFAISVIGAFVYVKTPIVKKALTIWGLYVLSLMIFAYISEETMRVQLETIVSYSMFIYIFVPLMAFSGEDFDMMIFFRKVFPYAIIICAFYILDAFVVNGHLFVPCTFMGWERQSVFYNPYILPFGYFPRIYPPALYILSLCVLPLARYYKLSAWQWLLVIGAFAATRTFTVISGLVVTYMLFQAGGKKAFRYILYGIIGLTALYFVDSAIPLNGGNERESFLRIKSSVDQIINISEAQDDKDISEVGSGRIAQAIPKLDLLFSLDKEWTGFGFLDRYNNTVRKYVIENEYYDNPEDTIEVATNIEITVLQVFITIGYIGLAIHIIVFLAYYYIIRRLRYAVYFGSVLFLFAWFGIGGFEGWITPRSLLLIALAFSVVVLQQKQDLRDERQKKRNNTIDTQTLNQETEIQVDNGR